MAIVTAERVNQHLSRPQWNEEQWAECELLCEEKESELSARLYNAKITPTPHRETVAILDSGLVATRYPVARVTAIAGTDVAEGDALPTGWLIEDHRLRRDVDADLSLTSPTFSLTGVHSGGMASRVQGWTSVTVAYMAGWGDVPALRNSILTKVAAVMRNRHDDSIIITEDGQARQPNPLPEHWSDDEIKALGIYRNLAAFR